MDTPFTIVVEGNIGAGKSTLIKSQTNCLTRTELIHEDLEDWINLGGHNLLELYYQNPKQYQYLFQNAVYQSQIKNILSRKHPIKLMERSPYSSFYVFIHNHKGIMTDIEFQALKSTFKMITEKPGIGFKPDLIVYVRETPEKCLERIKKRNRPEEKDITLEYLTRIHDLHEEWLIREEKPVPARVIIFDWNKGFFNITLNLFRICKAIVDNSPVQLPARDQQAAAVLTEVPPHSNGEEGGDRQDDGDESRRPRVEGGVRL